MQTAPNEDIDEVRRQRDEYKELYAKMREHCRKLELGFFGQKRERFVANEAQLTMSVLGSFFVPPNKPEPETTTVPEHSRQKPTGRKALPENLPRIEVEVLPDEVKQAGTEAFERIGEDVSESIERRPASVVVVRVIRPKFVAKDRAQSEQAVLQGAPLPLPIERGLAGPGFLADSVVRRWQDHLPLHRLERIYQRESLDLARSTICTWHQSLAGLVAPLLTAMWRDALDSPYLCTDATGVLVQALEKCKSAHFFVVAAPQKHVLFAYTPKHNAQAVDQMLGEYRGYLVADAHAVYDHLYRDGRVIEVGCWAHARRYFFKALQSDPQRAQHALSLLGRVFALERANQSVSAEARLKVRQTISKPIIEQFFAWPTPEPANSPMRWPRPTVNKALMARMPTSSG